MSASVLPDRPSGAELARAVRTAAAAAGQKPHTFAKALSPEPSGWLRNMDRTVFPSAATVARVRALLAGEPVPPQTRPSTAGAARGPVFRAEPAAVPPTLPVSRDPCFRCGVRGDIGCAHQPLLPPYDPFAHQRAAPAAQLQPAPPPSPPAKETTMPNAKPSDLFRPVTIQARDAVLAAIQKHADENALSLPAAAAELIKEGADARWHRPAAPEPAEPPTTIAVDLKQFGVDELLDELRERIDGAADVRDLTADLEEANRAGFAATARADAAEAKLARMRDLITGEAA